MKRKVISKQMKEARQVLSNYDITNAEVFDQEITEIEDKKELFELRTALTNAKNMFNLVRTFGDDELKETFAKLVIEKLPVADFPAFSLFIFLSHRLPMVPAYYDQSESSRLH